jgi:hypothetical protein
MKLKYLLFTFVILTTFAQNCRKNDILGYPYLLIKDLNENELVRSAPEDLGEIKKEVGELFFSNKRMLILSDPKTDPEEIYYIDYTEYETFSDTNYSYIKLYTIKGTKIVWFNEKKINECSSDLNEDMKNNEGDRDVVKLGEDEFYYKMRQLKTEKGHVHKITGVALNIGGNVQLMSETEDDVKSYTKVGTNVKKILEKEFEGVEYCEDDVYYIQGRGYKEYDTTRDAIYIQGRSLYYREGKNKNEILEVDFIEKQGYEKPFHMVSITTTKNPTKEQYFNVYHPTRTRCNATVKKMMKLNDETSCKEIELVNDENNNPTESVKLRYPESILENIRYIREFSDNIMEDRPTVTVCKSYEETDKTFNCKDLITWILPFHLETKCWKKIKRTIEENVPCVLHERRLFFSEEVSSLNSGFIEWNNDYTEIELIQSLKSNHEAEPGPYEFRLLSADEIQIKEDIEFKSYQLKITPGTPCARILYEISSRHPSPCEPVKYAYKVLDNDSPIYFKSVELTELKNGELEVVKNEPSKSHNGPNYNDDGDNPEEEVDGAKIDNETQLEKLEKVLVINGNMKYYFYLTEHCTNDLRHRLRRKALNLKKKRRV